MRKIEKQYENPIDNINIDIASWMCPFFKKLGFTPNGITTISLIFGLLSIYLLYKGHIWLFAITFYLSYFFDCMDGHYARKYDMVSVGGDMYDHVKDLIVNVGVLFVVVKRNRHCPPKLWIGIAIVLAVATIMMLSYFGCQEKAYEKEESDTLKFSKALCPGDTAAAQQRLKWLRYFGSATWIILVTIGIIYLERSQVCKLPA